MALDHVAVYRTDGLFISNCEPIAEVRRLRSGQMKGSEMLNLSAHHLREKQNKTKEKNTVPLRSPLAEILRQTVRER